MKGAMALISGNACTGHVKQNNSEQNNITLRMTAFR